MADGQTEIITLSSDEESKPKVITRSSKRLKVSNSSISKNNMQNMKMPKYIHPGEALHGRHALGCKQPVLPMNGTGTTMLSSVNNHQNLAPKIVKIGNNGLYSSTNFIRAQQPSNSLIASNLIVSSQNFQNRKSAYGVQNMNKLSTPAIYKHNIALPNTSATLNSKAVCLPSVSNTRLKNNFNAASVSRTAQNKSNNFPISVINSLQKNGISVTNVDDSKPFKSDSPHPQISQRYLDSIKYNLKKNNTHIVAVPKNVYEPSMSNTIVKSNSLCRASVKVNKRKLSDSDVVQNKSLCIQKLGTSSQNVANYRKYASPSILPQKRDVEKSIVVIDTSKGLSNISQFQKSYSTSQKSIPNRESSVRSYSKADSSKSNSLMPLPSKSGLTIIPIGCSNKTHKENSSKTTLQPSSQLKSVSSSVESSVKQFSKNLSVVPSINSSISVKAQNSTNASQQNNDKTSSSVEIMRTQDDSSKQVHSTQMNHLKKIVKKNIDVDKDRDALLSLLSLCNSTNDKETAASCGVAKQHRSSEMSQKAIEFASESRPGFSYAEPIKLKDVPQKIKNWPKLVVLLQRMVGFEEYTRKGNSTTCKPVIETPVTSVKDVTLKNDEQTIIILDDEVELSNPLNEKIAKDILPHDFVENVNQINIHEKCDTKEIVGDNTDEFKDDSKYVDNVTSGSDENRIQLLSDISLGFPLPLKGQPQVCCISPSSDETQNFHTVAENTLQKIINSILADRDTECNKVSELSTIKTLLDHIVTSVENEISNENCLETCNLMVNVVASFLDENYCPIFVEHQASRFSVYEKLIRTNINISYNISSEMSSEQDHMIVSNNFEHLKSDRSGKIYKSTVIKDSLDSAFEESLVFEEVHDVENTGTVTVTNNSFSNVTTEFSSIFETVPQSSETQLNIIDHEQSTLIEDSAVKTFSSFMHSNDEKLPVDDLSVQECLSDILQQVECTFVISHSEMEQGLSNQLKDNSSVNKRKLSTEGAPFTVNGFTTLNHTPDCLNLASEAFDDVKESVNLLLQNLICIIENKMEDIFTVKEPDDENFKNCSELKKSVSLDAQDFPVEMTKNEEIFGESVFPSFYTCNKQDVYSSDNFSFMSSEDEGSILLKEQVVTSPKLSLKRKGTPESEKPVGTENGHEIVKKVKLSQPNLFTDFPKQEPQPSPAQALSNEIQKEEENRKKFMELLEYSKCLMDETSEEEKVKIVQRLVHQLNSAQRWYASSEDFKCLLDSSWRKMKKNSPSCFIILYELKQALKKYKCKLKKSVKDRQKKEHSSRNSIMNEHECSSPINDLNECHLVFDDPLMPLTNENSVSKGGIEDDCQSIDSLFPLHSVQKHVKPDGIIAENGIASQISTSTFAMTSYSDNCTEKVHESHTISSIKKPPTETKENSDLFPIPSTSGLVSSNKSTKSISIGNVNNTNKLYVPSTLTSDLDLFPVASTSGLCSSKELFTSSSLNKDVKSAVKQDDRHTARIKKLEGVLADLDKAIKKCQKKELTLEDLDKEESAYLKEDRYKRRFNFVWKKLCELTKTPPRTGRIVEKRFHYEGSRYKAVNTAIENLINKKKSHEKFPDFSEVLNILKKVNDINDMGLSEREISSEAERVFKDVGVELQIRRCRDHEELFGCYLTDDINLVEDPAEKDENLRNILSENSKKFETSINELINSYAEKQKTIGEDEEKCSEEEDDDDEDENDDDHNQKIKADDVEEDLPVTQPSSPALSDKQRNESNKDDIIEIRYYSDKSTDPNDDIVETHMKSNSSKELPSKSNTEQEPIVIDSGGSEGSDEDLPSISELISS